MRRCPTHVSGVLPIFCVEHPNVTSVWVATGVAFSDFRGQEEDRRALKDFEEKLREAKEQALEAQEKAAKVLQEKESMEWRRSSSAKGR
jgi:hypothetical protein